MMMMIGHDTTVTTLLVCFCTAVILNVVPQVSASGIFEFRFVSFVNELSRDASGNCCSGYRTENTNNKNELCSDKCKTFFRVCLKHYQTNIDPLPPCTFGEVITPIFGNSTVRLSDNNEYGLNNPIQFPFNFSWPETFSLIVEAWHKHDVSSASSQSQGITPSLKTRTLITRLAVSRFLKVDTKWTHKVYSTNYTTLTYSYRILCKEHYYGQNCADLCKPRDDKFGHYTCGPEGEKICNAGWHGNYCEKAICRSGCNDTHGECAQPNECRCRYGWDGHNCDRCVKYPGCLHGYCTSPWECLCDEGWGGLLCNQDLNYCTNHKPCKNGGSCTNTGQGWYTCECPPGFTGKNCDVEIDSCAHLPCLNGATCKSHTATNYTCECPLGFFGRHCETMASACTNNPCDNGGTCIDGPSGYMCICKLGYRGDTCEEKQTDCDPNPCSNGGSCVTTDEDSYSCICRAGFSGDNCEVNINDCDENPCLNSGTCIDEINSFRCLCVPGYIGSLCQENVDDCLTKPCANGGTCSDMSNDYKCTCADGFTGKDCSVNINECEPNPCMNGAQCEDRVNEFACRCTHGHFGKRCEYSDVNMGIYYDIPKEDANSDAVSQNTTVTSSAISSDAAEPLSAQQLVLIIFVSAIVPLMVLVAVVIIFVCKHRKHKSENMRRKDELEARRQNEQNHSMNNKCLDHSGANVIVNALDRPPSLYHLNRQKSATLSKLTNEDYDASIMYARNVAANEKAATMQRTKSNNKLLNTECAAQMQKNVQHRPITKLNIDHDNMPKDSAPSHINNIERRGSVPHPQSVPNSLAKSESSINNSTLTVNKPMERDILSHNNLQNNNHNNAVATLRHHRASGRSNNSVYVIEDHYSQTPYITTERLYATEV